MSEELTPGQLREMRIRMGCDIPIVLFDELPQCERCGKPIGKVGLCTVCAQFTQSVSKPTLVSQQIPADKFLQPGDLN